MWAPTDMRNKQPEPVTTETAAVHGQETGAEISNMNDTSRSLQSTEHAKHLQSTPTHKQNCVCSFNPA